MEQGPVPEQPPPFQPVKLNCAAGLAVRVSFVLSGKLALHVPGQLIPAGLLVTVPEPTRVTETLAATFVNCAVTNWLEFRTTSQLPEPEHPSPLQAVKTELTSGAPVSWRGVPVGKLAVQRVPLQVMPAGTLVTVPVPVPIKVTTISSVLEPNMATKESVQVKLFTSCPCRFLAWHAVGCGTCPALSDPSITAPPDGACTGKLSELVSPMT